MFSVFPISSETIYVPDFPHFGAAAHTALDRILSHTSRLKLLVLSSRFFQQVVLFGGCLSDFCWWSSKLCHRQLSTGSEVGRIVVDLVGSAVCTCVHQVFGILCPPLPSDLSWCRCLEKRTLLFLPVSHVLSLAQKGSGQKTLF